jgi:4-hydroxybenzoate polyprenyltransferase
VQDVLADREAGVGSIATVIGARWTVRLAFVLYLAAGVLFVFTPWPLPLIGVAALGYLAAVAPWWSLSDARAESANRGWRWFLLINFVTGALVVLVLLEWWKISG